MLTAARGTTLILLGALLAQAPLTAQAYEPREPAATTTYCAALYCDAADPASCDAHPHLVTHV